MKMATNLQFAALLGTLILLTVTGCGPSAAELTPTIDPNMIRTEAVSTFASSLTQTALAKPTNTPTLTPSPTSSPTPIRTGTPLTQAASGPATCYNVVYAQDVTVPDNSPMTPGQAFTKTWRVRNTGSCAIAPGFTFKNVGGDPMGGQPLTLTQPVPAGATTDLSINMTAPSSSGTIQGTWRMADANGSYFGDPLTVVIVIGGSASTSSAPTETLTPEP
jgi:hypothetical protein